MKWKSEACKARDIFLMENVLESGEFLIKIRMACKYFSCFLKTSFWWHHDDFIRLSCCMKCMKNLKLLRYFFYSTWETEVWSAPWENIFWIFHFYSISGFFRPLFWTFTIGVFSKAPILNNFVLHPMNYYFFYLGKETWINISRFRFFL